MAAERVCDYPRPPRIEQRWGDVLVEIAGTPIAVSDTFIRVCETFHPPTIYLPPSAFRPGTLHPISGRPSFCEWKGLASYWSLSCADGSERRERAGWSYPNPTEGFRLLKNWISLYPRLVDACYLEGEPVEPQPGEFYGGWITSAVIGPFKGDPLHPELI